jgi:hypothetical protein
LRAKTHHWQWQRQKQPGTLEVWSSGEHLENNIFFSFIVSLKSHFKYEFLGVRIRKNENSWIKYFKGWIGRLGMRGKVEKISVSKTRLS